MEEYIGIKVDALQQFTINVFNKFGVPVEDAKIAAEVLITADQRGVGSHGLQRLKRYTNGLKTGVIKPIVDVKVLKETPNTLLISGGDGLGQVVGYKAMKLVIDKALKNNIAFAAVRDSNHYGIAGYYSMMALEHDLIGLSLTNAAPLVVPTHGKNAVMGTNPISIAVPAGKERPFVLDMAASTVPRGKLEVYEREGKIMPITWATDELGNPTQNIPRVLANLLDKKGGGLLPLGGAEEESGGHKGYGLCLVVDIFSGVLSGSEFGPNLYARKDIPAKVAHFFGAIKIDAFIELALFKSMMDEYINILKNSEKAAGKDRIFIHGEKEFELYEQQKEEVRLYYKVVEELRNIGEEVNIKAPF
ncbi:MAG: malate dehydrogenase [Chloroflexi bacterium CG23_combo_of_CG06-09_8_20_14_all_45_10]|nr:MAG: malate dehydrogenase [Chloroflexi bacterium CG23_combo_of_CG06-09_8_20_14_all_45_10]